MNSAPEKPDSNDPSNVLQLQPGTGAAATERARIVAALHSAAEWIANHPNEDVPITCDLNAHLITGHPRMTDRLAGVHAFADRHAVTVQHHGTTVWASLELTTKAEHGIRITYSLLASTDTRSERWNA